MVSLWCIGDCLCSQLYSVKCILDALKEYVGFCAAFMTEFLVLACRKEFYSSEVLTAHRNVCH